MQADFFHHSTLGDLRRAGEKLEFVCSRCSASRLFDPYRLPFGDLQLIVTAHRRMKCSACGWEGEGSFSRAASWGSAVAAAQLGGRF